jgi:hypothetical protein
LEVPIQCSSTFKRPSALNVQNHSFLSPTVEDLKNIQTLQVTFVMQTLPTTNSFQYLNRISVWLLQKPSNDKSLLSYQHDELNVEIVVEADNVSVECLSTCPKNVYVVEPTFDSLNASQFSPIAQVASSVKTVFGILKLNASNFAGTQLDLNKAQCSVCFDENRHEAMPQITSGSKIVCRIPYVKDSAFTPSKLDAPISFIARPIVSNLPALPAILCAYCEQNLFPNIVIDSIKALPSGSLDGMMHDFICCIDGPVQSMSPSDVETPTKTVMLGEIFAQVSIADCFRRNISPPLASAHEPFLSTLMNDGAGIDIICKSSQTILDLYTSEGSAIASKPIPKQKLAEARSVGNSSTGNFIWTDIISVDSCLVTCGRCGSYLGIISF